MTPVAGAAADLRHPTEDGSKRTVLRYRDDPPASRPRPVPNSAAGTFQAQIIDGLTTILGLLVFACIAMFFLVLA
jgi:hypothetical protein